jgi:hypothetical protein
LSRIWVVELAMTAWPISVPSRSAASCVMTDSPAQRLRAALAMRSRNLAPSGSFMSSHTSSTTSKRGFLSWGIGDAAPDGVQGAEGYAPELPSEEDPDFYPVDL